MRFIGNKENLVEKIYQILQSKGILGTSFFDFFAGTCGKCTDFAYQIKNKN
jgi:adenine-specific DNA-methyltransferase